MAPGDLVADTDRALGPEVGRAWCPHLAMLLGSVDELHPALAAFYALGAGRNGWLLHRSLPEQAAADRAGLTRAGLDVASLEAQGRLTVTQVPVTEPPERWAEPWVPVIEDRLRDGFDAVWWSRFPVKSAGPQFERALRYDEAWDAAMRGRRAVSLCVYIVPTGDADGEPAARLAGMHDGLLHASSAGARLIPTRPR